MYIIATKREMLVNDDNEKIPQTIFETLLNTKETGTNFDFMGDSYEATNHPFINIVALQDG